jgi:hypothetical protein
MTTSPVEKIKIFISSVQNQNIENLEAERAEVVSAVQNYSPTVPWAFEYTPASDLPAEEYYLRGVQDCHLFFLLLGGQITEAVRNEYYEALRLNKPVFAFIKDAQRTEEAEELLKFISRQSKYSTFKNSPELVRQVVSSLNSFLVRLVEDNQVLKEYPTVRKVLADFKLAGLLQEYAQQLLSKNLISFEAEVTHYLNQLPISLRDISKFYIPMRVKISGGALETIDDLVARHRRVIILGPPGSGKTTELLNFSTRLARRACEKAGSRQVPIYIGMRSWAERDVISQLEYVLREHGLNLKGQTVDDLLRNYKVSLLFDGLDEVSPLYLQERINQIKSIAQTYENTEIVVACRITGYVPDLGFQVAHLEPLQEADIVRYMNEFTGGKFDAGRFYSWSPSLRELSRYFIMLNFIANISVEGVVPNSLTQVYEKYFDFLFNRWEIKRGAKIAPAWKKRALNSLAIYMQVRSQYYVSEDEAINKLRELVSGEHVDFSSVDLLNELVSSGIMRKEDSRYTFWHASFREYLASQLLINKIRNRETISEFVLNPAWEPVVIFASGLFDDIYEMSRFLFEVLDVDPYLYTQCLANALSAVSSNPTLPDEKLTEVILHEMLEARTHLIKQWLPDLLPKFSPYILNGESSQPAIVGRFSSEEGGYLLYGYTTEAKLGVKVRLLSDLPAGTTLSQLANAGILSRTVSRGLPLNEAGVVGAHRIALEDIWLELKDIIKVKSLIEPSRLIYEQTQAEVRHLARNNIISLAIPADISKIETQVNNVLSAYRASQVILGVGGKNINLNSLLLRLSKLADSGYTSIGEPLLPNRDRIPQGSNWVTQFYEDKTLINYVKLHFLHFLEGYSELVRLNFRQLSHRLGFHQLLPVRVVAEIERPVPSKDMKSMGSCHYYFEPLDNDCQNEVIVSLNQKISQYLSPSSDLQDAMSTWLEKLKRYGRWNSSVHVWSSSAVLGIFFGEQNQVRSAVYDGILRDLTEVFEVRKSCL